MLVSCNNGGTRISTPRNNDSIDRKTLLSDSIKEQLKAQDSISNELSTQIDTISSRLNSTKQDVSYLQNDINNLRKPSIILGILCLCSLVLSIIAIVIVFILRKQRVDRMIVSDILDAKLSSFNLPMNLGPRLNRLEQESKTGSNNQEDSSVSLAKIKLIENRIERLELRYSDNSGKRGIAPPTNDNNETIISNESSNIENSNDLSNSKTKERSYDKLLYTGLNNEKYFMEIYNTQQEPCVYKIICRSDSEGDFTLISLDKIKSSNGWRDVVDVETKGECTIEEAQLFTLIDYGKCEKFDEKTWKVTQNLKIKISK